MARFRMEGAVFDSEGPARWGEVAAVEADGGAWAMSSEEASQGAA